MSLGKLAIHGGAPARGRPLPPNYPGALLIAEEEVAAAAEVLRAQSPFRYYGPAEPRWCQAFEDKMAADVGVPYALGVSSCTAALIVSLKALGIGYGDKVVVPANTFIATAGAVVCAQAVPVFADIDDSLNLDPKALDAVIDDETKAVIAVHILGASAEMNGILAAARRRGIPVIEDVAQSCGGSYKGRMLGSIGNLAAFSFQLNKMLTAGEGGAVATSDPVLFERAVRYHDQGEFRESARYGFTGGDDGNFSGQNYRMSEISGAILLRQWEKLDRAISCMRGHHDAIRDAVSREIPQLRWRTLHDASGHTGSNLGMILPSSALANEWMRVLQAENINTYTLYRGKPVYMEPSLLRQRAAETRNSPYVYPFRKPVRYEEGMCPNAVDLMPRAVFLPIAPLLTERGRAELTEGLVKAGRYFADRGELEYD